jgi:hypothetical protein
VSLILAAPSHLRCRLRKLPVPVPPAQRSCGYPWAGRHTAISNQPPKPQVRRGRGEVGKVIGPHHNYVLVRVQRIRIHESNPQAWTLVGHFADPDPWQAGAYPPWASATHWWRASPQDQVVVSNIVPSFPRDVTLWKRKRHRAFSSAQVNCETSRRTGRYSFAAWTPASIRRQFEHRRLPGAGVDYEVIRAGKCHPAKRVFLRGPSVIKVNFTTSSLSAHLAANVAFSSQKRMYRSRDGPGSGQNMTHLPRTGSAGQ